MAKAKETKKEEVTLETIAALLQPISEMARFQINEINGKIREEQRQSAILKAGYEALKAQEEASKETSEDK